ncbi:Predicted arabinose efflux permease, MFS family [Rhizobiales bacterium GAS188]|nr:Predicted arabinose efflux permease, MFS family [Rhizobiales bacterium GAS188]
MTPTTAPPRLTTLILLSALAVLPVNMILPSLPNIAATFQADFALVNLSVAGYAIVTALTQIIAGAMSDRYGRRPVVLMAVSIFIVASVGSALATNIGVFLLFRAMQASIAACFSVALVIIKETSGERKAASKIGYLAMGWAIAPMLGPMFGGVLDGLFGWRANFVVLAILGAAVLALSMRELSETAARSSRSNGNYLASYGQLLSSARFWGYTLCMACSMGTLYVFLGGAPLAVGKSLGGSSAKLGFYMGMVPAGFILGSYLAGRYASQSSLNTMLILGRLGHDPRSCILWTLHVHRHRQWVDHACRQHGRAVRACRSRWHRCGAGRRNDNRWRSAHSLYRRSVSCGVRCNPCASRYDAHIGIARIVGGTIRGFCRLAYFQAGFLADGLLSPNSDKTLADH